MQWCAYGHDFGNSTISGTMQIAGMGKPHTRSIPTTVAKLDVSAMCTLGIHLEAPGHHHSQLENNEYTYFVGELALQQG